MTGEPGRAGRLVDLITTGLDLVGLAAVAVGVAAGLWPRLGWFAVAVGGGILWIVSWSITVRAAPGYVTVPARVRAVWARRPRRPVRRTARNIGRGLVSAWEAVR